MPDIWHRDWELTIGTTRISPREGVALDIAFEVEKSLAREPNTATIKVFNLGRQRRDALTQGDQLELRAGYLDLTSTLFVGEVRRVYSERHGPDVVTMAEARDGGREYRTTRLDRGWSPGTLVSTVVDAAVEALGIGAGNLGQYRDQLTLEEGGDGVFREGYVTVGPAWRVLSGILSDCGLSWSVQNGNLQVRQPGQPAELTAVHLSASTGLIGSPTRDLGGARGRGSQRQMTVNASSLLRPGLYPGRVVVLESSEVEGNFRVKRARYVGDTSGDDWRAELVLEAY